MGSQGKMTRLFERYLTLLVGFASSAAPLWASWPGAWTPCPPK